MSVLITGSFGFIPQTKPLITDFQEIYYGFPHLDPPIFRGPGHSGHNRFVPCTGIVFYRGIIGVFISTPFRISYYLYQESVIMAKFDANSTLKRLQNRYRLVVMNDDTYEEVVTFKLSRLSVYVFLSTVFVLLTGLTVALIVFTPLKLYIPGYGDMSNTKDLRELKIRTDSLEQQVRYKDQYLQSIRNVLQGSSTVKMDTTMLNIPKAEKIND